MRRWTVAAVALLVSLMALPALAADPLEDPIPAPIPDASVAVSLVPLTDGLVAPLWGTTAPGHDGHLFVVDQPGQLWAVATDTGDRSVVLDVASLLVPLGVFGPGSFDERGFLGAAFDAGFADNGWVYTYTSEPGSGPADYSTMPDGVDANHQTVISRWTSTDPSDPYSPIDPDSRKVLLRIDQPQFNHNAGALAIGPDELLYIALGDGGGADDLDGQDFIGGPIVGHGDGNGQDISNPLGAILRIDPSGSNSANGMYGIPEGNPFTSDDEGVDEIFAYGFRNPYRMSFDREEGALYTGDVGQNDIEEVDVVVNGGNYGWNYKEGSFFFDPNGNDPGFVTDMDPGVPPGLIDPIAEYDHDEGVSVIGGFVYRGSDLPQLYGNYVFGEFAPTFSNDGRLFGLRGSGIQEIRIPGQSGIEHSLLGFGEDAAGELYAMVNLTGTPSGETGAVLRIAPAPAKTYVAELSGDAEVPPVATDASGTAELALRSGGDVLNFRIDVSDIEGVTQAHIHLGPEGENGAVVAFLFGFVDGGVDIEDGRLVAGRLTADDLIGPLEGMTLHQLFVEFNAANAYVNVHTVANPPGELRGQIVPEG